MTDEDLLAKKLAFIETCLRELRELGRADRIASDLKERRFVEHTLPNLHSSRARCRFAHRVGPAARRA